MGVACGSCVYCALLLRVPGKLAQLSLTPLGLKHSSRFYDCRHMACHAKFVPVRITKVRAVVVSMVMRSSAGQTLACPAVLKCHLVSCVNHCPRRSREGDHLTIPRIMLLAVIRFADNEKGTRLISTVPARPRPAAVAKAHFNTEAVHKRGVDAKCSLEVGHAHENM